MRALVPLLVGLVVGAVGVTMFRDSLPGTEGSPEERANKLELELKQAHNRIVELEAAEPQRRSHPGRTLMDEARSIADDIREGRPVNPEDIFRASKPLLRDFAPLFDRMRLKQQQQMIDGLTGELARKYDLSPQHLEALKKWFEGKATENAKAWSNLISQDSTRLEDLMRASRDVRLDEGLDTFMESLLSGDSLAAFKTKHQAERAERVQRGADMKVQRLDSIVGLNESQRDQVFSIVARGSPDYDPSMGLGGAPDGTDGNWREAMVSVLTPEQRDVYEAARVRRRAEVLKELETIGLTLPPDWDIFNDPDF